MNKYRISAKKMLLTYRQVDPQMTVLHVLEQLESNISLHQFKYVIAKKLDNNNGTHFHVIIIQEKKTDIKNSNALDIKFQEQSFHANYVPVNSLERAINHVCKNNQYITNLENLQHGQLLPAKQLIISQVKEKSVKRVLIEHDQKDPEKTIAGISISALKKQFNDTQEIQTPLALQQDKIDTPFTLENFNIAPELQAWIDNPKKTLIIVGNSGIGKTQFCKALVKFKNLKTLLINDKQDYERLNNSHQCIIVDDVHLHEFEETQLLSIIESQTIKCIKLSSSNVIKKANIVQIIAMNKKEFRSISATLQQPRFARRLLFIELKQPFMINVNINIVNNNINIYNQVGNEKQTFEAFQEAEQLHIEKTRKAIRRFLCK